MKSIYFGIAVILASAYSYLGLVQPNLETEITYNKFYGSEIEFDQDLYETLKLDNKPVLLRFTADWCIYCKYQEPDWNSKELNNLVSDLQIVKMKVDLTKEETHKMKLLRSFGRNSIPTYVFIKGDYNNVFNGWSTVSYYKNWIKNQIQKTTKND